MNDEGLRINKVLMAHQKIMTVPCEGKHAMLSMPSSHGNSHAIQLYPDLLGVKIFAWVVFQIVVKGCSSTY